MPRSFYKTTYCGDAGHDGLSLHIQVPIHLVGFPTTDETNAVAIDPCTEEGHCPTSVSGTSRDIGGHEAKVGEERTERRTYEVMWDRRRWAQDAPMAETNK